jgi:hypothetical protein
VSFLETVERARALLGYLAFARKVVALDFVGCANVSAKHASSFPPA